MQLKKLGRNINESKYEISTHPNIPWEEVRMKPVMTEKAVMMIERDNTLVFETAMVKNKADIKKELEEVLKIKVDNIRTLIRKNKKYAYVKLKGDTLAIDVATKLGLM
jgi:large subunit ribosomal protein L23